MIAALPESIWDRMGIENYYSSSRSLILIVASVATLWLLFGGLFDLLRVGKTGLTKWVKPRLMKRTREESILSLSKVEKEVLAKYIINDTTTLAFDMRDGIVNGLISKAILYRASQATNPMSYNFDINIQPWAWEYLESHPKILQGIEPKKIGRHQFRL